MRFFLLILFLFLNTHAYGDHEYIIIVVNRQGPLVDADMGMVRDIYLGEKKFEGNVILKPINFKEGDFKDDFLKAVLGMSSKQYKRHWIKKVFQEGLSIPVSKGSPLDIIEFVSRNKGAVAYLPGAWAETIRSGIPRRVEDVMIIGESVRGKYRRVEDPADGKRKGE